MKKRRMGILCFAAIAIVTIGAAGCGGNGQPDPAPVEASNVFEDGHWLLGDFESYRQVSQVMQTSSAFGKMSQNTDLTYVTRGKQSLKLDVQGSGEVWGKVEPSIVVFTDDLYFQKKNFTDCDLFCFDIYNDVGYEVEMQFSVRGAYQETIDNIRRPVSLKSGWNSVELDTSAFVLFSGEPVIGEVLQFYFTFDRYEKHNKNQVYYLDNFRARKRAETVL